MTEGQNWLAEFSSNKSYIDQVQIFSSESSLVLIDWLGNQNIIINSEIT
jgi:hypothetical protein